MQSEISLNRSLSLPLLVFYGLGTILGAGIYVLIGEVAAFAGIYAPLSFIVAVVIATFTALSYAELSARMPKSAGEAHYVQAAFSRKALAVTVGWAVVLTGVVSAGTLVRGFVGYFHIFFAIPEILLITILVLSLGLLAAWGIFQSVFLAMLITLVEVSGLIFVIVIAGDSFAALPDNLHIFTPGFSFTTWTGILFGTFIAFYAFIGFEDMVNVAEEVRNPRRNLPLGIFIALALATILYILIAVVAVLSMPLDELQGNTAPLAALVVQHGYSAKLISAISLIAVINGALIQVIMASRVVYGMANSNNAPKLFARISPKTQTPINATIWITLLVLVFALYLPLVTLASITSFVILLIFTVVNAALLKIKFQQQGAPELFSVPKFVPVLGILLSLGLVLFRVIMHF
jgi:amino acid transporter